MLMTKNMMKEDVDGEDLSFFVRTELCPYPIGMESGYFRRTTVAGSQKNKNSQRSLEAVGSLKLSTTAGIAQQNQPN